MRMRKRLIVTLVSLGLFASGSALLGGCQKSDSDTDKPAPVQKDDQGMSKPAPDMPTPPTTPPTTPATTPAPKTPDDTTPPPMPPTN